MAAKENVIECMKLMDAPGWHEKQKDWTQLFLQNPYMFFASQLAKPPLQEVSDRTSTTTILTVIDLLRKAGISDNIIIDVLSGEDINRETK